VPQLPAPAELPEVPAPQTLVCANCHAPLSGEYCAACGQRHEPHVHTIGHFVGEAFESISHADSRLWRTLAYLLGKPGYLTREFFEGRRARYLPPFRLYLVISVLFFLVAGTPEELQVNINNARTAAQTKAFQEVAQQLEADNDDSLSDARKKIAEMVRKEAEKDAQRNARQSAIQLDSPDGKPINGVPTEVVSSFCDEFKNQATSHNEARNNLRDRCLKIAEDGGKALGADVVHNLPRAMFVFLPLLALFMRLLYWKPKRYYVEHLLFLLHNHASVFLTLTLLLLVLRIPHVDDLMGVWLNWAAFLYMVWYIYRAMRKVYQQGRVLTIAKYVTLGFAYLTTSFVVFLLTALYSAMTV
jgi:hypothetical protein